VSPGLIKFVSQFRQEAKKTIKDEKDFMNINKKTVELFNEHFSKHGKSKVVAEIEKLAEAIKNSRKKK
jgi:ribosomal protein S15P/S13E